MRIAFIVLMLFVITATVSACNTVQGFGRDMRAAGDAITRSGQ